MRFACLTYHGFGDADDQYVLSAAQMLAQLKLLDDEGYTVEGFQQLHRRLSTGEELPGRYVVLTLDDGLITAMRAADWIAHFGFTATFFVTRDRSLSKPAYMRERDIRQLREDGFSLGTHGTTHRKLTRLSAEECRAELRDSRSWLESVLGEPIRFTAVPGGFINGTVEHLCAEAGYLLVGTCNEWMNTLTPALRMPTTINRVNVRRHFSLSEFRDLIKGRLTFYARRQVRSAALWLPKQLMRA